MNYITYDDTMIKIGVGLASTFEHTNMSWYWNFNVFNIRLILVLSIFLKIHINMVLILGPTLIFGL